MCSKVARGWMVSPQGFMIVIRECARRKMCSMSHNYSLMSNPTTLNKVEPAERGVRSFFSARFLHTNNERVLYDRGSTFPLKLFLNHGVPEPKIVGMPI